MNPPASTTLNPGGSVLAGLRILKRELVVVGIFSFVTNVLMLTPTLYMLQIFDRVMASRNELTLLFVSLLTLALFMVIGFCEWSRSKLLVWAGMRFDALFSQPIFSATHRQALAGESRNPGVALAALTNLRQFVTGIGIFAFFDLPWTPIYLAFMFLLHPVLGLVGTLFVLNLGLLFWLTHYVTTKPAKAAADEDKEVQSFLHNHLRAAEVVESMGLRANFLTAWRARNAAAVEATRGVTLSEGRLKSVVHLVRTLQQSFLLGLGGFLVIRGELHLGGMIAANVLLARASYPLDMMVGSWKGLIQALQASNTLNDLLGQFGAEPNGRRHKGEAIGNVHVDRVTARAKTLDRPILDQLELHFQPGEIVAVVGPSGSGKSTLMKVLAGIWPMTTGAVKIDGIATHDWDREVLGRQLGYLPQEIDLYGGTFAENIARFGEVDPDAVIAAAQRATIHDLLLRFPNGYDTPVLEGGMNLSAGQRQRVALARALYGSPAIVLLDEPNAHLDDVGESALQRALLDLKSRQATVIVASHRSNILSVADRLLMLRDGRVVYDGPPQGSPSQLHAGGALPAP